MEMFLDKNGTSLQRRKMYVGFPLHNMKSHLSFDWQNDDPSIQDQMGKRYKLNQEREQITKKYTDNVNKSLFSRYVELHDDNVPNKAETNHQEKGLPDTLAQELEQFNKSKAQVGANSPHLSQTIDTHHHENEQNERLNQSRTYNSSQLYDQQYDPRRETINYRYEVPFNPQNYSHPSDRYGTLDLDRYNQQLGSSPSKFVEKMYTGSAPNQYPFRNVIPDNLETHLRERTKADRKKAVKVSLNLFDYYTRR